MAISNNISEDQIEKETNYFKQMGTPKIIGGIMYSVNKPSSSNISTPASLNEFGIVPSSTSAVMADVHEEPRRVPTVRTTTPEVSTPETEVSEDELPEISPIVFTLPTERVITNPIVQQVASTPLGKHIFKHENMDVGNMQALLDEAAKYGISFRITSGARPGAKTKQGKTSHHATGNAIDITPIPGETYDDLRNKIRNAPEFVKWMQDHGYGIFDETSPEVMAKTGASGAHWHIGPDKVAIEGLKKMLA